MGTIILLAATACAAEPRRILYLTATFGYRHGSIEASHQVLRELGARSGRFEVDVTEDPELINAANLRNYAAVFFFTSGELPFTPQQRSDLLDFIRAGGGFGGAHSATDTLYTWPEYGELIGGVFDGHPWVHNARVLIDDPNSRIVRHLAPSFEIVEEFYQFRSFSRDRVHVLAKLDNSTIDLNAPGVNRADRDFALAWIREYGRGRVFYTALGHFDETWNDPRIQNMLLKALEWIAGVRRLSAAPPRKPSPPVIVR
jgi:type 1 glutamine amidotransferase